MRRKITIALFVSLSFCFPVLSQSGWSLEECISYAIENNLQVKAQRLDVKIAEEDLANSKMAIYPNLNAGIDHNYTFGRSVDRQTNDFSNGPVQSNNFNIGSNVTIFQGFQKSNAIKRDEYSLKKQLQDVEKIKNDISLNVAATYLQILFTKELINVNTEQLDITKQQIDRTNKMVLAGKLAKGDLLEIQAQKAQEELEIVNLENDLSTNYLTLTQLLELDSAEGFEVDVPKITAEPTNELIYPVVDVYNDALEALPEIKSAELNVKTAEKTVDHAIGKYYPSLSLRASINTGYSDARKLSDPLNEDIKIKYPFSEQFVDNSSEVLSFNLSIPIFNNFNTRTQISQSKIRLAQSRNLLQMTKNKIYKDIQNAHNQAKAAYKKYVATKEALKYTQEAFKYSEQKFNVGLITSVEYNTAKTELNKVKSELVQAKYNYVFKTKILDFYRGNELTL